MQGYMLQGSYGKFGLTVAMLRRCNEFTKQGIECTSLTVDFTDDIYDAERITRDSKKVDDNIVFRNPFVDLSNDAKDWSKKTTPLMEKDYLLTHVCENEVGIETSYFKSTGDQLNSKPDFTHDNIKKKLRGDVIIYEDFYLKDKRVCEKFYSETGQCICIRKWDPDTNKQLYLLVFDYSIGFVRKYNDSFSWNVSWITEIIKENPLNGKAGKPFIICDGPGSAAKITKLNKELVTRIYVLHNNHKHNNGKITKRDEWNLKSRKNFDHIVALTDQHTFDLKNEYPDYNFTTIPNFTDISKISPRETYNKNRIGFFGQLIDRKGVKDAIDVISILRKHHKIDVYLDIYGVAPVDTELAIKNYSSYANEKEIGNYINFLGYTQSPSQEMGDCLCTIFPSYSEAQGLSIVEALAVGTPVVAYDCNYGPSSMITNGINGYISEVGNRHELAANILSLFKEPNKRIILSQKAILSAKEIADKDRIYDLWLNIIK